MDPDQDPIAEPAVPEAQAVEDAVIPHVVAPEVPGVPALGAALDGGGEDDEGVDDDDEGEMMLPHADPELLAQLMSMDIPEVCLLFAQARPFSTFFRSS